MKRPNTQAARGIRIAAAHDGEHQLRNRPLSIKYTITKRIIITAFSALISFQATTPWAAGSHGGGLGKTPFIGKAGKASDVTRTVKIVMHDNYYDMEYLAVKRGETIRFVITNAGEFVHEFNIGTKAMHAAHAQEMLRMVEHGALEPDSINYDMMKMDMGDGKTMTHDDPNSVLLEPSKSAEIIWKFPDTAGVQLEFACNLPGHYEAGMVGRVYFPNLVS